MKTKEYELGELLSYEQPTPYIVESTKYSNTYKTPVLTAGKSFIIGYTNETTGIYDKLPVIIFDDFTTSSQYVNFKFKVKSSAMKILTANKELVLPKYIFYRMQIINFEHSTHKRYWIRQYSKLKVAIPSIDEQNRIVSRIEELFSELDKGVETLQIIKEQLAVYRQAVLKMVFASMNERKPIQEVSSLVTSGSRGWAKYYSEEGVRFIRITDLTRDKIKLKNNAIQHVLLPEEAEGKRSRLQGNDVLISITADLGSIALVPEDIEEAYINQHIALVRFLNCHQGEFMAWYLKSDYGQKELLCNKRGGGKLGLGLDDIRNTSVPIVSDEVADEVVSEIESRMSVCDSIEQTVNVALSQAEAMRQSILKKALDRKSVV